MDLRNLNENTLQAQDGHSSNHNSVSVIRETGNLQDVYFYISVYISCGQYLCPVMAQNNKVLGLILLLPQFFMKVLQ